MTIRSVLGQLSSKRTTLLETGRYLTSAWDLGKKPQLHAAARRGDTKTVEDLLEAGANPDIQDDRGETALHKAVRRRHAETSACLLAYGSNFTIADNKGRTPLSLQYTTIEMLHAIRQRHRRFRTRSSLNTQPESEQVRRWVSEFEQKGIVKISGLVKPEVLMDMRASFEKFIKRMDEKIARGQGHYEHYDQEEYWWESERAYVCNNAFKDSRELVKFCCNKLLVDSANHYLGKQAHISRGNAMRYLPHEERTRDMFGWHHDMEEKRLKAMILLTDIGESDQTMSYVLGSHAIYHPYKMFFRNMCPLDYCRSRLGRIELYETIGKAGDVFLFDSNGAHRGNRRPNGAIRDAIFIEYTTDSSDIWGGEIPDGVFDDNIPMNDANPFAQMVQVNPKWNLPRTRKAPTWVENLPRVETWVQDASRQPVL